MSETCAIILNWNTWADTLECLESLLRLSVRPGCVIVVDNGSRDDSVQRILAFAKGRYPSAVLAAAGDPPPARGAMPEFVLLRLPENLGCGQGNNAGLAYALAGGAHRFFWVLNSDAAVEQGCLAHLLEEARTRPEAGVIGASVLSWAGGPSEQGGTGGADQLECAGGCRYLPWATMTLPAYAGLSLDAARRKPQPRLDYILGACFFVRREVLETVGLFSPRTFLYYEEADFCLRAAGAGFVLAWSRGAVVRHKGGQALAAAFPDRIRRKAVANYHENLGALRFTRAHYPGLLPVALAFRFFGKLAVLCVRRELALAGALLAAYRDFLLGRPASFPGPGPCPGSRNGSSEGL